jgi:hypothetical protein
MSTGAIYADLCRARAQVVALADLLGRPSGNGPFERETPEGLSALAWHVVDDLDTIFHEVEKGISNTGIPGGRQKKTDHNEVDITTLFSIRDELEKHIESVQALANPNNYVSDKGLEVARAYMRSLLERGREVSKVYIKTMLTLDQLFLTQVEVYGGNHRG